ncbi:hypothetical protein ABZ671_01240 [Micromonospora sp. NPDC006766]|uniref:hypothetical protein n=1 Tax=Micromonospora sp. NPDC006766 TaxID=3154778 RepID=UPI0033FAD6FE
MTAPTTTLIRTRHRRSRPAPAPTTADRVCAALDRQEPVMLAVANAGRGWWAVDATPAEATVRRHGQTMTVAWDAVTVDEG